MPTLSSIAAVGVGAAVGAWLRWALSVAMNPIVPMVPLGTLAANLIGGLLMGIAMEVIARNAVLAPEVRLLVTTGFLGGLTTFSTFSAEVTMLLVRREWIARRRFGRADDPRHPAGADAVRVGIVVTRTWLRRRIDALRPDPLRYDAWVDRGLHASTTIER